MFLFPKRRHHQSKAPLDHVAAGRAREFSSRCAGIPTGRTAKKFPRAPCPHLFRFPDRAAQTLHAALPPTSILALTCPRRAARSEQFGFVVICRRSRIRDATGQQPIRGDEGELDPGSGAAPPLRESFVSPLGTLRQRGCSRRWCFVSAG